MIKEIIQTTGLFIILISACVVVLPILAFDRIIND